MQRQAVEVAEEAMSKFQVEKDIAQYIKKEVRPCRSPPLRWRILRLYLSTKPDNECISLTLAPGLHGIASLEGILEASSHTVRASRILTDEPHADSDEETKHFIYFYLGHCAILLFKTQ